MKHERTFTIDGHVVTVRLSPLRSYAGGLAFDVRWWSPPQRLPSESIRAFEVFKARAVAEITEEFMEELGNG